MQNEKNSRERSKATRKIRTRNKKRHEYAPSTTKVSKQVFLGSSIRGSETHVSVRKKVSNSKSRSNKVQRDSNQQASTTSRKKNVEGTAAQTYRHRQRGNRTETVSKSSSTKQERNHRSSKQGSSASGVQSLYDIFGQRLQKPRSSHRRSYRAEYQVIELPQQPEQLFCSICHKEFADTCEILESIEIQPGEFSKAYRDHRDSHEDSAGDSQADFHAAHFECVINALTEYCQLAKGESVAYLGAGKFAVVQGSQRQVTRMIDRSEWQQNSSLSPLSWAKWRQDLNSPTLLAALSIETDV